MMRVVSLISASAAMGGFAGTIEHGEEGAFGCHAHAGFDAMDIVELLEDGFVIGAGLDAERALGDGQGA